MLRYPLTVAGGSDTVSFSPQKYRANSASGGSAPADAGANAITLYMPNNTPNVGNPQGWAGVNFEGPLGAVQRDTGKAITAAVMGLDGQTSVSSIMQDVKSQFDVEENIGRSMPAVKQLGLQMLPKKLMGGTPNQMLAISKGQVYNPNVELIYSQPGFRNFVFNFDFIPKSRAEAQAVNQIILEFKKWSAPKDLENGMFEVPYVWQVKYSSKNYMNKFKPAACTNVSVVYNSNTDLHVSHRDGAPVQTSLSLAFMEVDIITRGDHEKAGGQGY